MALGSPSGSSSVRRAPPIPDRARVRWRSIAALIVIDHAKAGRLAGSQADEGKVSTNGYVVFPFLRARELADPWAAARTQARIRATASLMPTVITVRAVVDRRCHLAPFGARGAS